MRFNVTLVALIAVAALVAAGGCGGDGDASGKDASASDASGSTQASKTTADPGGAASDASKVAESSGPLTKAELIKRGDKICSEASSKVVEELQVHKTEYGRGFGRQPTKKQNEEGLVDLALPVIQQEAEEIAALDAPAGDEDEIEAIAKALEEGVAKTEAKPSLAESSGAGNPLAKASTLSQAYGFKVCGS